uniref:FYVE-type domain-containing protein n=1 Tax=Globisporangium ultimum (strain ATCC 200006 / CBS 805.95 / DAOM BR144) TaxID=431595 RepID=K3X124_GLOUD
MAANTRDYHQRIRVTPEEQTAYDDLATNLVNIALIQYSRFNGLIDTDDWSLVRKRKQMSIYRSIDHVGDPHVTLMTGSGLIHGSLEDAMDGLYCDTTTDLRTVKTLLHYKLLNAAVLNVSKRRTDAAPFQFAGIKWTAANVSWGLTKHRDLLTYERVGTTRDENGHELVYYVLESIDRPEWPVNSKKGIKRAKTSTCYLFKRLPDNRVEVFLWGEFYDIGSVSQRIAEYVIAGIWLNVVYSVDCAEAKKCSKLMARSVGRSWPKKNSCHVCRKSTNVFKTPRQCAGCSQRMCTACSCYRATFQLDMRTGKPVEERFCKLCVNKIVSAEVPRRVFRERLHTDSPKGSERVEPTHVKSTSLPDPSNLPLPWKESEPFFEGPLVVAE